MKYSVNISRTTSYEFPVEASTVEEALSQAEHDAYNFDDWTRQEADYQTEDVALIGAQYVPGQITQQERELLVQQYKLNEAQLKRLHTTVRDLEARQRRLAVLAGIEMYQGTAVELMCPSCKQKQTLQANMIRLEFFKSDVLAYPDHCEIDWDNAEVQGEFEFICEQCGTKLASDIPEVENKLEKEKENG